MATTKVTSIKLNPEVYIGDLTQQNLIDAYRPNWKQVETSINQLLTYQSTSSSTATTLNGLSGAVILQENGAALTPAGQILNVTCVASVNGITGAATVAGTNNAVVTTGGSTITVDGKLAPSVQLVRTAVSSYTMLTTDYMIRFTTATTPTLIFLAAASVPNKIVRVILLTGATLTVTPAGGDTIEAWPLTKYTEWVSDGVSNWYVVLDK